MTLRLPTLERHAENPGGCWAASSLFRPWQGRKRRRRALPSPRSGPPRRLRAVRHREGAPRLGRAAVPVVPRARRQDLALPVVPRPVQAAGVDALARVRSNPRRGNSVLTAFHRPRRWPGCEPARISGAGQHLLPASVRAGHRPLDHFSHLMTVATGFSLCPPTLTSTFSP
jgi:hypothetical protein